MTCPSSTLRATLRATLLPPALVLLLLAAVAHAHPRYQARIPNGALVRDAPGVGHVNPAGTGKNNAFGLDFAAAGHAWTRALCEKDSDGDGFSNGVELGDPNCTWSPGEMPTFDVGVRHPGVPEGSASAQYDSCTGFQVPNQTMTQFNFKDHGVRAVETDYVCQKMKFPADRKRWVRKLSPIVQHPEVVHHMIIYACDSEPIGHRLDTTRCSAMSESCQTLLYAWAVGAKDLCLPEGIGFPVGVKGMTHMLLEIHYDNPKKLRNVIDSSGVAMTLTDVAPTHEAGMLMVGDPGLSLPRWMTGGQSSEGIHIPPDQRGYEYSIDCPSVCTDLMISDPQQPLTVIATGGHAHSTGVAVKVDRIPKGSSTPFVIFDEPDFDFDLQQLTPLPPSEYKTIVKGDRLRVHCTYDTTRRSDDVDDIITTSGLASDQEMCLGLLVYYPRLASGANCLSGRTRTNADGASSYAVCSSYEHIDCACDNPTDPVTCMKSRGYANRSGCVEWWTSDDDDGHFNNESAVWICEDHCKSRSGTFMNFLNSRDGKSPIDELGSTSAAYHQIATFLSLGGEIVRDCTGLDGVVACSNTKCMAAIRGTVEGTIIGDVGVGLFTSALRMAVAYESLSQSAYESLIREFADIFTLMKKIMMTCSLCTSSKECPMGNMCYCDALDTVLCRCVNENDHGKKDAKAVIFQGFPFNVDKSLSGTWTSLCVPQSQTSVRETYSFSFHDPDSRVFEHTLSEYDDHKCTEGLLWKTQLRSGNYTFLQGKNAPARGSVLSGPLELGLQIHHDTNTCPDYHVACRDHQQCIPESFLCDGWCDCDDGSDELDFKADGSCNHSKTGKPLYCPAGTPDIDPATAREKNADTLRLLFQVGSPRTTDANFRPNVQMQVVTDDEIAGVTMSHVFHKYLSSASGYGGEDTFDAWVAVQDKTAPPFAYGDTDADNKGQADVDGQEEGDSGWAGWLAGGLSACILLLSVVSMVKYGKQCLNRILRKDATELAGTAVGAVAVNVNNPLGQVEMQETTGPAAEEGIARGATSLPSSTPTSSTVAPPLAPPSKKKKSRQKKRRSQMGRNLSVTNSTGSDVGHASVALNV
jgi:dopamine beta-monooxygenase